MKTSNYAEVRDALYHRESFTHGSCHGIHGERYPSLTGRHYLVYSYATLVLDYDLDAHRVTYFDNRQYSQTTSRLQSMIRAAFPEAASGAARILYSDTY